MEDWRGPLQFVCTIITIAFFSTGVLTCIKIKRDKSVRDVNFLPYVMTSLNCLLWCCYGILVKDNTLCLVNLTGALLQFIYMFVYFKYVENEDIKKQNLKSVGASVVFMALILAFASYKSQFSDQKDNLGLICDCVTILMFASPLSTLGKVIRTKSTASISFPLSVMVLCVSLSWFSYGTVINDLYVKIPNLIGGALGLAQISLFCIYRSSNGKPSTL